MSKAEAQFDAIVVGAGPAGATAALAMAAKDRHVALIDAAKHPRPRVCAGWLGSCVVPLLGEIGVKLKDLDAVPINNVAFFNADFTKTATPKFPSTPGYLIDRAGFDEKLVRAAESAGVSFHDAMSIGQIRLGEEFVTAEPSRGVPLRGSVMILASGRKSQLLDQLRLGPGSIPSGWWAAHVEAEDVKTGPPKVSVVLGLDNFGGIGVVVSGRGRVTISVQTGGERAETIHKITTLCKHALAHDLIDVDLSDVAARSEVISTPAAVALAMDTHVAKRTLIVGDAGGFVSATSGEGIYPGMWSAKIAADVAHEAIGAPSPQDVLMEFNTRWRTEMAEYLRPPNTETQYILPLIFSNQPMADRMGAAFFAGQNI